MNKEIKIKAGQKLSVDISIDNITTDELKVLSDHLKYAIENHDYTLMTNYDYTIRFIVE
jgi:hypothetical protein